MKLNKKTKKFVKNFTYTFSSNAISMLLGMVITLIVPKVTTVTSYGWFQLFIFYTSYIGIFHFGFCDGVYLREGGSEYDKLNKNLYHYEFWILLILQSIIAVFLCFGSSILMVEDERKFVIYATAISLVISNTSIMLSYIMQATGRIKEYSRRTLMQKIPYVLLVILCMLIGISDFRWYIVANVIGLASTWVYGVIQCKDIVFAKTAKIPIKSIVHEISENVSMGIKLMLANFSGLFILGIVRFGIESEWSIETFGKISFTLSVSNLLMLFVNAVAVIMFPTLRRMGDKKKKQVYLIMRDLLMVFLLAMLLAYYPVRAILEIWLPQYSESLEYMAILFPLCIFSSKMSMLITPYLNTLRLEKYLLYINIISVVASFIGTIFSVKICKSLVLSVFLILFLIIFRCVLGEIRLAKDLGIEVRKNIIMEIIMTIVFVISSWYITGIYGMILYGVAYVAYIILKRNDIKQTLKDVKMITK